MIQSRSFDESVAAGWFVPAPRSGPPIPFDPPCIRGTPLCPRRPAVPQALGNLLREAKIS